MQNENAISEHSQFRNERDPAGEAPARDFVEREFFGNISAGLSSNLPIFDRYTWITLGREVPAGPYSGSAASDRQRASNLHQQVFDIEPTNFNSTCFDRIRVVKTSDAEIEASLIQHTVEQKTGSFFVSKSASRPQKLYMGIAVNNSDPETQPTTEQQPFVGVEHFNSPEFDTKANDTIDTGRSPAAVNTAAQKLAADVSSVPAVSERIPLVDIVTEADRHLIQTAIRNTLSGSVLSSALNKDSENICTPAAGGSPVTS